MKRVTLSIPWPLTAVEMRELTSFIFRTSLVTYLGFALMENMKVGFVTLFFDLNALLWVTLVTGVVAYLWPAITPAARRDWWPRGVDYIWLAVIVCATMSIVWYKTSHFGIISKIITLLSGLIVLGLTLSVYTERDDDSKTTS